MPSIGNEITAIAPSSSQPPRRSTAIIAPSAQPELHETEEAWPRHDSSRQSSLNPNLVFLGFHRRREMGPFCPSPPHAASAPRRSFECFSQQPITTSHKSVLLVSEFSTKPPQSQTQSMESPPPCPCSQWIPLPLLTFMKQRAWCQEGQNPGGPRTCCSHNQGNRHLSWP